MALATYSVFDAWKLTLFLTDQGPLWQGGDQPLQDGWIAGAMALYFSER